MAMKRKNFCPETETPTKKRTKKEFISNNITGEYSKKSQEIIQLKTKNISPEKSQNVDWKEFKKHKKELRDKRRASSDSQNIIAEANRLCERLRQKKLVGEDDEKSTLAEILHKKILENKAYSKFILKHDASRVVQCLLKYSNKQIRKEISKEIIPYVIEMIQSRYGRHCIKTMLKLGDQSIRDEIIKRFFGSTVKVTSHSISASIFEFAYTFASSVHKKYLIQEYFGEIYKHTKDDSIQHLRDIYANSPEMKVAALGATKANLLKVINKNLLDSALVQTVLHQFLTECSSEDREEFISQLSPHAVVLSNSKDGVRALLQCIWHGTSKDRKTIIKALKQYVVDLSQHEHGHITIIGLLDAADDTVLLNKIILTQILENVSIIVKNDWGRKILLWLVAPAEPIHFHPAFVKYLESGRANCTCKKDPEVRRKELLHYSIEKLLENVTLEPKNWLITAPLVTLQILKAGFGDCLRSAYESIVLALFDESWRIKDNEEEYVPLEHPAVHMAFKKLIKYEQNALKVGGVTFAKVLTKNLTTEMATQWIKTSRGCFLMVFIFEYGDEESRKKLNGILQPIIHSIKNELSKGAKVLFKKLKDLEI